jgi:hypothetical protein
MPIWKLSPIDLLDPNWEASSHRSVTIVRAPDEAAARAAAAEAFDVTTRFPPGAGMRVPPWTRATLVSAEQITDQRYDPEGPVQVLDPAF